MSMNEKIKKIEVLLAGYNRTRESLSKESVNSKEAWVRVKYYMGMCAGLEEVLEVLKGE